MVDLTRLVGHLNVLALPTLRKLENNPLVGSSSFAQMTLFCCYTSLGTVGSLFSSHASSKHIATLNGLM